MLELSWFVIWFNQPSRYHTYKVGEQQKWLYPAMVPKKDVIVLLPYIGLHSNLITKRLKSCVNRFYYFVNVKVIFQNTRRIKSFFPYKDRLNRSQLSKVIYKASCWDCNDFYIGKTKRRLYDRKRNISRPFWNMITLLQLLITSKQLVTTSNGTILASGKTDLFIQELQPALTAMSAMKSFYSIKEAFSLSLYRQFPFETS